MTPSARLQPAGLPGLAVALQLLMSLPSNRTTASDGTAPGVTRGGSAVQTSVSFGSGCGAVCAQARPAQAPSRRTRDLKRMQAPEGGKGMVKVADAHRSAVRAA